MMLSTIKLTILLATLSHSIAYAAEPIDIPKDIPISSIISSANEQLAAGNPQDALAHFDVAISRDPQNYLTIFKRGATYLSLGKPLQAQYDFDRVLSIKPDFEGALIQRAKLKSKQGQWKIAKEDYATAGIKHGREIEELEEAELAAKAALDSLKSEDWDSCISQVSRAIVVASVAADLRDLRARCRLERGDAIEAISDLQHFSQLSPNSIEPYLKSSALLFYSLGDTEKGLSQIRKCLQSDPDSKSCRQLLKREKALQKRLNEVNDNMEKRKYAGAVKLLTPSTNERGLLQEVADDIEEYKEAGYIHAKSPRILRETLVEITCSAYIEMNNHKRAFDYCMDVLKNKPSSLYGLISKAQRQLDTEDFESAVRTLNEAREHHRNDRRVQQLLQKANTQLQRSKQKDYYKVLGVSRDADEREIKRAYRKQTLKYHPDKISSEDMSREEAEKKMATINEAYEVLGDSELKTRYDNGDDPNDHEQGSQYHGSPFGFQGGQPVFFRQGAGGAFSGGSFQFPQGFEGFQFGF